MFRRDKKPDGRLFYLVGFFWLLTFIIIFRLFYLQVWKYSYYNALAVNTHEIYKQLFPTRGSIYIQDSRPGWKQEYPVAIEKPFFLVYAVPRDIPPDKLTTTTDFIAKLLKYDEKKKQDLVSRLGKSGDPYEPIANQVESDTLEKIKLAKLTGINWTLKNYRYYPESRDLSNLLGFVGSDLDGNFIGRYGVEGGWDKELSGRSGFLAGQRGAIGELISTAGKITQYSQDGVDLLLTIDRSLQNKVCQELKNGGKNYQAKSGAAVMLDAKTGAVRAMCSYPDFDPNKYYETTEATAFNNTAIFTPYEPGSVFKPITMAIGLDLELVSPNTLFNDPGVRVIDNYRIYNALQKQYGTVTMTQVLENSINTGMIWVEEKIGLKRFNEYVKKFGFGEKTGLQLDGETTGDISSLEKTAAIYGANGSFGQGFTITPLQLATAYTALANGGKLMKPYIVQEIRYPSGQREKIEPQITANVISARAQKLLTGMLTAVVEKGYSYIGVKMDHYYVAGKTGTAQIAGGGGYTDQTNHTFVGYLPANDPQFVLLIKYETPQRAWAESTAAPTFKNIAEFAVKYYGLKEDR